MLKHALRHSFRTHVAFALIAGAFAHTLLAGSPPNLVFVLTDDQGYGDIGVHGNDVIKTPYMDRLANESVELTQFYCSPVCAPTRASLMTGRYIWQTVYINRAACNFMTLMNHPCCL